MNFERLVSSLYMSGAMALGGMQDEGGKTMVDIMGARQTIDMLAIIAEDLVPQRPDRFEPRCLKRRPKAYPFMKRLRHELRAAQVDHLPARRGPYA